MPEARLSQHSGVQLLLDGIEDTEERIERNGWAERKESVSAVASLTRRVFTRLKIFWSEEAKNCSTLLRHALAVLCRIQSVNKLTSFSALFQPTPSFQSRELSPIQPRLALPSTPRNDLRF
ncbi:hypothetical protein BLNAU_24007 [Blattamonas nauphoetae]|uniref:Transposase n=1 Tax=Blattamonas nauphoetae TaxID=2049346 RepID=A0ABQ9WSS1_9EUKA|nr:hypothetical protein BLNAU_24007 [Blattamonas nauphoetae]